MTFSALVLLASVLSAPSVLAADDYLYYTCTKNTVAVELAPSYGLEIAPDNTIQLMDPEDYFTGGALDESTSRNAYVKFNGFSGLSTEYVEGNYALLQNELLKKGTKNGTMALVVKMTNASEPITVRYECKEFVPSPQ